MLSAAVMRNTCPDFLLPTLDKPIACSAPFLYNYIDVMGGVSPPISSARLAPNETVGTWADTFRFALCCRAPTDPRTTGGSSWRTSLGLAAVRNPDVASHHSSRWRCSRSDRRDVLY